MVKEILQLSMLILVILENFLGFKFAELLVFQDSRPLGQRQSRTVYTAIAVASIMEFINKEFIFYFSIPIMACKILIIGLTLGICRKRECISVLCILTAYFAFVQAFDCILIMLLSPSLEGITYEAKLYPERKNEIKVYFLIVRIFMIALYYLAKYKNIKISNKKLLGILAAGVYGTMIYFYACFIEGKMYLQIHRAYGLGILMLLAIMVVVIASDYSRYQEQMQTIEEQKRGMEQNAKHLYETYKRNRYLSHDLKNHLNILEAYIKEKEWEKAGEYLRKIKEPVKQIESYVQTENTVIDTILNYKIRMALDKQIQVIHDIDRIGELEMEEKDICTIMANLTDNAIEACEKVNKTEKWMEITLKKQKGMLFFRIENSYSETPEQVNGKYQTRKNDGKEHGIGLENVEFVLDKYGGNLKVGTRDGKFCVSVIASV